MFARYARDLPVGSFKRNPLCWVLSLIRQSDRLRAVFFFELDGWTEAVAEGYLERPVECDALSMRNLLIALLYDAMGNARPDSDPMVPWLMNFALDYFVIHRGVSRPPPVGIVEQRRWPYIPCVMLPVAAALEHLLQPVGDLQRQEMAITDTMRQGRAEIRHLQGQASTPRLRHLLSERERLKQVIKENNSEAVRAERDTVNREITAERKRCPLPTGGPRERVATLRALIKQQEVERGSIRVLYHDEVAYLHELIEDPARLPDQVVTATGHCIPLRGLLLDRLIATLRMCLENIKREYMQDEDGDDYRGQNYHPWRKAWADFAAHPLLFLKQVTRLDDLEQPTPRQRQVVVNAPRDSSVWCWRTIVIATVLRELYARYHDTDVREKVALLTSNGGGCMSELAFMRFPYWCANETRGVPRMGPRCFSVPVDLPLSPAQWRVNDQFYQRIGRQWYEQQYSRLARARVDLCTGTPPLSTHSFPALFRWMERAQPCISEATMEGDGHIVKRRRLYPAAGRSRITVHCNEGTVVTTMRDSEVDFIELPSFSLRWESLDNGACNVVVVTGFEKRRQRLVGVIDERGQFYATFDLRRWTNYATEERNEILKVLEAFDADPHVTMSVLGHVQGRCCGSCKGTPSKHFESHGWCARCDKRYHLYKRPSGALKILL